MPNTPAAVGEAASVMSLGGAATEEDANLIATLFGSIGKIWRADEKYFDAITGLSGSGPTYVYLAIEALADGGVVAGLPRDLWAATLTSLNIHKTARMRLFDMWIDFVNLRSEEYTENSRIPSKQSFGTPEEDAYRRDFLGNGDMLILLFYQQALHFLFGYCMEPYPFTQRVNLYSSCCQLYYS